MQGAGFAFHLGDTVVGAYITDLEGSQGLAFQLDGHAGVRVFHFTGGAIHLHDAVLFQTTLPLAKEHGVTVHFDYLHRVQHVGGITRDGTGNFRLELVSQTLRMITVVDVLLASHFTDHRFGLIPLVEVAPQNFRGGGVD